jgi:hypothetical protein
VCETKKVPKTTYDCECEEFCVPGRSQCTTVCDECGHNRKVYRPTCAKLRTRTKLVKKETVEEKCVYKWVVEDLCCDCAAKVEPGPSAAHEAPAPAVRQASAETAMDDGERPTGAAAAAARFDLRRLFEPGRGQQ